MFFVTLTCGVLGQGWYLIVSIPDICLLLTLNTYTSYLRDFIDEDEDEYLPLADDYGKDSNILTLNDLYETVFPRGAAFTVCMGFVFKTV